MSAEAVWESVYRRRDWGRYPAEELVRFVARNYYAVPLRSSIRILDLGCGPGAGASWFVAREGFGLCGIDSSPTAIAKARERFTTEGLAGDFRVGAIDALPWPDGFFDAVIDSVCLAYSAEREAALAVAEIGRVMKAGGRHFSMTPKAGCWGDRGDSRVDDTTLLNVGEGPFAGFGLTRFATLESLQALYSAFHDLEIEYSTRSGMSRAKEISHWIVTCRK
ncbi:MAG: class I SAM-dependent methyltransferase [Betaproteobacteria bacterium]